MHCCSVAAASSAAASKTCMTKPAAVYGSSWQLEDCNFTVCKCPKLQTITLQHCVQQSVIRHLYKPDDVEVPCSGSYPGQFSDSLSDVSNSLTLCAGIPGLPTGAMVAM